MKVLLFLMIIFTLPLSDICVNSFDSEDDISFGSIVVEIDNIDKDNGQVFVGIFNSPETFRKTDKVFRFSKTDSKSTQKSVILEQVPFNEYAVVIFQDTNGNNQFDTNLFGIPLEPFGFSTNYKVKTKAPKYHDVLIAHNQSQTALKIALQKY